MAETNDLIKRVYTNFRGVDFRGEEINLSRSPDSKNIWKDYRETESIRTRPGLAEYINALDHVYGIFFYNETPIIHAGTKLYKLKDGKLEVLFEGAKAAPSCAFIYENAWYFKDGLNYLSYDGETIKEVEGYIPTTTISRKPAGGGTEYEEVNLLTGKRINTFLADGGSLDFYLDAQNIDSDYSPIVKVNDTVQTEGYTVDYKEGKISFTKAPDSPLTTGQDNVSVQFSKTIPNYRDSILKCTMLQVFDNRAFFSGNSDFPNVVWHCALHDPSYCSDRDFYREGMDVSKVTGIVAGNNALWVFREPSDANTNVFYHIPTIDDEHGKIYPSSHSSISTGCIGKAINFNDDIVFFSNRGMEGISGDITTEQVLGHRSTLVDRKLLAEENYKNMLLEEWEGYLLVFIDNKVYLADSRGVFTNENHIEYEWFYWELDQIVTCTRVHDGVLYVGTADGAIYTVSDMNSDVESWWITPKDKFGNPNKRKTTNKRGCISEATGDISLYVKTEGTEFSLAGTYEDVTDYFVSRIKQKKFKDIQMKFYSTTRFSLESTALECFVGAYIKR